MKIDLRALENTQVEVTLLLSNGASLAGVLEKKSDFKEDLPLMLKGKDGFGNNQFFFVEESEVVGFSVQSLESLTPYFSKKAIERLSASPPTVLDILRGFQPTADEIRKQAGIELPLQIKEGEKLTEAQRWNLSDFVPLLGQVLSSISKDDLGRQTLKKFRTILLQPNDASPGEIVSDNNQICIRLNLTTPGRSRLWNVDSLRQAVEEKL